MKREVLAAVLILLPVAARAQDPPPPGYDRIVSEDCLLDRRPRDASLGDSALALFREARTEVEERLGAKLGAPAPRLILAPTEDEFARLHRELTGADPAEWVLAIAVPWKHAMLMKGNRLADGQNFLAPTLRHELAHLVNAAVAARGRQTLPRWLDEGLAEYAESRTLTREEELELGGAARFGRLESFESLTTSFPPHAQQAERAYRMSLGFVSWLDWSSRGRGGIRALVAKIEGGSTVDQAIKGATGGWGTHEAEVEWQLAIAEKHSIGESLVRSSAFWWGLVSVLAILAFVRHVIVSRRTKKLTVADAIEDAAEPGTSDVVQQGKGTP